MSRKRSAAAIEAYHRRFVEGAMARFDDVDEALAERVYTMIVGFSGFGFPKAHGAAFGLLAYQSTWLRVHYGPEFLASLLDEQPMGFYPPDSLVHEAQRRGDRGPAAGRQRQRRLLRRDGRGRRRIGLGYVLGVRADEVAAVVPPARPAARSASLDDLVARAGPGRPALELLAWSGACDELARRDGAVSRAARRAASCGGWARRPPAYGDGRRVRGSCRCPSSCRRARAPPLGAWSAMVADYATTGLTVHDPSAVSLAARSPRRALGPSRAPTSSACRTRHGAHRRPRRRPPAPGDGQRHRRSSCSRTSWGRSTWSCRRGLRARPPGRAHRAAGRGGGEMERFAAGGGAISVLVHRLAALDAPAERERPAADVLELPAPVPAKAPAEAEGESRGRHRRLPGRRSAGHELRPGTRPVSATRAGRTRARAPRARARPPPRAPDRAERAPDTTAARRGFPA
jgi:error-prone DNA polymerase